MNKPITFDGKNVVEYDTIALAIESGGNVYVDVKMWSDLADLVLALQEIGQEQADAFTVALESLAKEKKDEKND